jgi:ATP-dependent exoDNAse (exonuclease V) alpha subunit
MTQEEALSLMTETLHPILLTGGAGTGKSYLIHKFMETQDVSSILLCAPTGVAAQNIGGQTLHRTFQIPFNLIDPADQARVNSFKLAKGREDSIRNCSALIIDEISMVSADLLEYVSVTCQKVLGNLDPFGGIRVILVGDPFQLPPVCKERGREETVWFFLSQHYAKLAPITCNLTKVYRQENLEFSTLLNKMREGRSSQQDLNLLNSRIQFSTPKGIILTAKNSLADEENTRKLNALPYEPHTFPMKIENFTSDYHIEKNLLADEYFKVRAGSRVIMLNNDSAGRWINGTLATVRCINNSNPKLPYIVIQIDGCENEETIEPFTWESYELKKIGETYSKTLLGRATQFPMKLGWAITIHKSQGLSFSECTILTESIFAAGQAYVAFSRCRTLEGLSLKGKLLPRHLLVSRAVQNFYNTQIVGGN